MRSIHTEIIINAPAGKVWNILTDFNKHQEWNPFIRRITGDKKRGGRLRVTLDNGKGTQMTLKPKVLDYHPEKKLEWIGHLMIPGIFDGNHFFEIEAMDADQVRFIHGEHFRGVLSGIIMNKIGADTRKSFEKMNQALKTKAEKDS